MTSELVAFVDQLDPTATAVLWVLSALVILWAVAPPLGHVLGLTRHRIELTDYPSVVEPGGDDPAYEAAFAELRKLGFHALGGYRQRFQLYLFHWLKEFHTRVLVSEQHQCFACIYRLVRGDEVRVRFTSVI